MAGLRELVRSGLQGLGLEVRLRKNAAAMKADEIARQQARAWRFLASHGIETVIDVGANTGQFAEEIRARLPSARILSFEPLPGVFAELSARAAADDAWHAFDVALSDGDGEAEMQESAFSPSSSLLPMTDAHRREWPASADTKVVRVRTQRLDDWAQAHEELLNGPMLLKIDVQGHELAVLEGGPRFLERVTVAVVEVSYVEFYEGQPLFDDIHARMRELGFEYRGNVEQYQARETGEYTFADALFLRR